MGLLSGTKGFTLGFATGFGAGLAARDVLPHVRSIATPAMRVAIRSGILMMERSRELMARFGETLQDSWAEVQMELRHSSRQARRQGQRKSAKGASASSKKRNRPRRAVSAAENVVPLRASEEALT